MSRPGSGLSVRWAAVGAAVAVSLGAGGFGIARATSPSGAAAFVSITPCRLFDTRPDSTVGDRATPIGEGETHDVAATGPQGDCNLPEAATGVVLNMTAVGASQATFLTVWPKGEERPTASSLNPTPGGAAAPNAVTVDLSADGAFSVFNRFGSVHVLADVVGYFTDHHHDDRYYTEAEVDARLAALESELASLGSQLASLETEHASLESEVAALESQLDATNARVEEVDASSGAAWKVIPSGVTVTGDASFDGVGTWAGSNLADFRYVDLPGMPPTPLTSATVRFQTNPVVSVSARDTACTGSYANPTAPPGKVCVYLHSSSGVSNLMGWNSDGSGRGFSISYVPTVGSSSDMFFKASWAYTAP